MGVHPIGVIRLGEKIVLWRDQEGKVCAAVDRCPNRGVALSAEVKHNEHLFCPFHSFEFDSSGQCVLVPANGRNGFVPNAMQLITHPTYKAHG